MTEPLVSPTQYDELLFTQLSMDRDLYVTESIEHGSCRGRFRFAPHHLRPGGTVSGPTMMMLADTALYGAVLSVVGMVPLAVTTDLNFHFMRKPAATDLLCQARVLKAGKRMVVGEFHLFSDGSSDVVCAGQGSYSVPPADRR